MIQKIKRKLSDKSGAAMIFSLVLLLVIIMVLVGTFEITRITIISRGVRDAFEKSVTSVAINNAYNSYNGVREGNSGAYQLSGEDDWRENISTSDVVYKLTTLLKLKTKNGEYISPNPQGSSYEFKIADIEVTPDNAEFASNSKKAKYSATCTVTVPLSFGFENLKPVVIHMRHKSIYVSLFE